MMVPGFLAHRLAGVVAGGAALLLAAALVWVGIDSLTKNATIGELRRQVTTLTRDLDQARTDLGQCRSNRITLEEATRRQNEAVAAARADGNRRVEGMRRQLDQERRRATAAAAEARGILDRRGTGNHCADAEALIRELTR